MNPDRFFVVCRGYLFTFCVSNFARTDSRRHLFLQEISNFLKRKRLSQVFLEPKKPLAMLGCLSFPQVFHGIPKYSYGLLICCTAFRK